MSIFKEMIKQAMALDLSTKDIKLKIMSLFSVSEKDALKILINARNELNKEKVKEKKRKILFLSHCMRERNCKAETGQKGLVCKKCNKECQISKIIEFAGMPVFIVPGGSMVFKIIEEEKPDAIIGVACSLEIEQAISKTDKIPAIGIPLIKEGCIDTKVDLEELKLILDEINGRQAKK